MAKDLLGNIIKKDSLLHVNLPTPNMIARVVDVQEGVILAQIQIPIKGPVVAEVYTIKEPSQLVQAAIGSSLAIKH